MKIIDGKDIAMGRLASFTAKELLKGEDIIILNCSKIIITGNKKNIQEEFLQKRSRIGSSQKGPKHSRLNYKIVKRTIRGMLPDYREGRGRIAWKKLRCYDNIPKEFEGKKFFGMKKEIKPKYIEVEKLSKFN
ncbi:MAG: 50S ribosomal protein L13 [Candidatus Pacearchaeota archaeon]|jgi:ribosomal protein uL13